MRLFLHGQRRKVTLPLEAPGITVALDRAGRPPVRTANEWDRLQLRSHANGRVRCRVRRRGGKSTSPPYFHGHLRETGSGVVLQGVIRESRSAGFMTAVFTALTIIMAAVAVACAMSHPLVWPGLVICSVATLAFGPLSLMLRSARVDSFRVEANELERKIRQRFGVAPAPLIVE